jgi:hypothetical protein
MKKILFFIIITINCFNVFSDDYQIILQDNWGNIKKYINDKISNDALSGIGYSLFSSEIREFPSIYITLFIHSGNSNTKIAKNELFEEMKIYIKEYYLNNFNIYFEINYPFSIIYNNILNIDSEEKLILKNQINSKLPKGINIIHLFNLTCFGEITVFIDESPDMINFVKIIIEYFGIDSIIEF